MINYVTGIFCFVTILVTLTYCSKQADERRITLEKIRTESGQTRMDVKCSRVTSAEQATVCVAYFNSLKDK